MELRIKGLETRFPFSSGKIFGLCVEEPEFYYRLVRAFFRLDEELIVVVGGDKICKTAKEVLYFDSFSDLSPNSKASLTTLYKKAGNLLLNGERQKRYEEIEAELSSFLSDISLDFSYPVIFDDQVELGKIMQSFNFRYDLEANTDFYSDFIAYVKAALDTANPHFLVAKDLFSYLPEEKIPELEAELESLGITMINIVGKAKGGQPKEIKTLVLDGALCEF